MFINKNKKYIGIDIGDKYLKLSLLSKIDDLYSVDCYSNINISNYVNNGRILNTKEIGQLISEFIQEYNIVNPELIFSFPNKDIEFSQTKIFKMKTLSKKDEMKSAIEIEVEDRFNNVEDKLDWKILSNDFFSHTLIYATSYKEEIVNEYENIVKDLKYSYSIIPKNLFLTNSFDSINKTILLVDIGFNSTDLILYHNNLPLLVKNVNIGGNTITEIISSFKSISYDEAEKLKISEGLLVRNDSPINFTPEERELSSIIETQIQVILNDIDRIKNDIFSEFNINIDEIKLCGGSSNIKYLSSYFEYNLDIQTEKLIPSFLKDNKNEILIEESNIFNNSFSASFLSFQKPIIEFSLKKKKQENEKLPFIVGSISFFIILFISVTSICGNFISDLYLRNTNDKLNVIKTDFEPFLKSVEEYKSIITQSNSIIENANELKKTLDTIDQIKILPIDVLTKLKTHTPKNTQIDTFVFNNKKIEIEGVISDYMSLGYFIKELELVDEFNKIDFEYANVYTEVSGTNNKSIKNLKFKITIDYVKNVAPINQSETNNIPQ